MKTALFVCLVILAIGHAAANPRPAPSQQTLGQNGDYVRLDDAPCTSTAGKLAQLPPEARSKMKAAEVSYQGRILEACWALANERHYYIVDEDGDQGLAPRHLFAPVSFV